MNDKKLNKEFKLTMISDLHYPCSTDKKELLEIVNKIENEKPELKELILDINNNFLNKKLNFFYIPFQEYRIFFIKSDNSEKNILTFYGKFDDDKLFKILDVGYIILEADNK